MKVRIWLLTMAVGLSGMAWAGLNGHKTDLQQATLDGVRALAESGHAAAQNKLGAMYQLGQEVAQDHLQALAWYRKSAQQGNADAQTNLCTLYLGGLGVPQDN
ncbi:sel1 repeat family protein [Chitinimonas arctica]|uniref:Sel1 repeat family protein n=1 Tax=Chitinimonas arctica TaxID=2594795 RepID=A0A516SM09_9NEIS|nr:tetratricopeptide repeat protein [Chitinimonas arctica]QDQ29170.1 sel1 repeat family protein [Chitinimonas arctica]